MKISVFHVHRITYSRYIHNSHIPISHTLLRLEYCLNNSSYRYFDNNMQDELNLGHLTADFLIWCEYVIGGLLRLSSCPNQPVTCPAEHQLNNFILPLIFLKSKFKTPILPDTTFRIDWTASQNFYSKLFDGLSCHEFFVHALPGDYGKFIKQCLNPDTPDRFTPSHALGAENCESVLTHR